MKYAFWGQTDLGRVRDNNEDSVAFDATANLGVLADGMGGYLAGEIASGMATTLVMSELAPWLSGAGQHASTGQIRRAMEICIDRANRSIFDASRANHQYAGMGTTLVLGVFRDHRLLVGHIGDSRCYRWRGHTLLQLTKDHSLLQEQVDAGLLTPEQAATAPHKNLVTRALGVDDVVLLELNEYRVEPGDIYLMCSDGLSDMIQDAAIARTLQNQPSLASAAAALLALANDNGGRDNIAVLLVQASTAPEKRGFMTRLLGK